MAFVTPTHPNAAKVEAAELRAQAARLLGQANALDPTEVPEAVVEVKVKKTVKKVVKKGKK